jgi:hypothetical protein
MNKASEIFLSWRRALNPTNEQTILAGKRYTICQTCPSKQTSIVFTEICGECGCPLGKKIFTPRLGSCPLEKWNKVENL